VEDRIKRAKSLLTQAELNRLKSDQVSENKSIRSAYAYERDFFEQAWSTFLERSREKEREHISQFKLEKSRIADETRSILAKKCHSLKNKSSEIILLEKQEQYFKKRGDIEQLSVIKQEKKKLVSVR
jgi:hypothetical protein